jgi:hypothetical protein
MTIYLGKETRKVTCELSSRGKSKFLQIEGILMVIVSLFPMEQRAASEVISSTFAEFVTENYSIATGDVEDVSPQISIKRNISEICAFVTCILR